MSIQWPHRQEWKWLAKHYCWCETNLWVNLNPRNPSNQRLQYRSMPSRKRIIPCQTCDPCQWLLEEHAVTWMLSPPAKQLGSCGMRLSGRDRRRIPRSHHRYDRHRPSESAKFFHLILKFFEESGYTKTECCMPNSRLGSLQVLNGCCQLSIASIKPLVSCSRIGIGRDH